MHLKELIAKLKAIADDHGDVYVSVRHEAAHEFSPDDDLLDLAPGYDPERGVAVIKVRN